MARYFDPVNNAADMRLIPKALREHGDLDVIAEQAEEDVIDHYTERVRLRFITDEPVPLSRLHSPGTPVGDGLVVGLFGYEVDANDPDVDPKLKRAMKREIASVVRWRARQWDRDPVQTRDVRASNRQTVSSLRQDAEEPFPPTFGQHLGNFDIRQPTFTI